MKLEKSSIAIWHSETATFKKQIVIHSTQGTDAEKLIELWAKSGRKQGLAYYIKEGVAYELFDPKFGSYHIGKVAKEIEESSIGILVEEYPASKRMSDTEGEWHANLETLVSLIKMLCQRFSISQRLGTSALEGESGIYLHSDFKIDSFEFMHDADLKDFLKSNLEK